jgi:hypothetical protein
MLVVFVGPTKQRFSFHQVKVYCRSRLLEASCSTYRIKGQPPRNYLEVNLPDYDVEVFQEYWEWVYSGNIYFRRCDEESDSKDKHAEHMQLVNLYKLGCSPQLDDVQLRDVATLEFSKSLEACYIVPTQNLVAVVWSITPGGDGLRRLIVDFLVARAIRDEFCQLVRLGSYPTAFVHELTCAALCKAPLEDWKLAQGDGSRYRESEEAKKSA